MTTCICGVEFEPSRYWQKYCSPKCRLEAYRNRIWITCPNCGEKIAVDNKNIRA